MTDFTVPIRIPKDLRERLKAMRKPHQAIAGVIEDLIADNCVDLTTMKRLDRYRTHPRETIGDLIKNALDQLDELEKTLTAKETR